MNLLVRVSITALLLAGLSGSALVSEAGASGPMRAVDGFVFIARGVPVVHAELRVVSLAGKQLPPTDVTGKNGTFSIHGRLPARFILESFGGTAGGRPAPTLRALVLGTKRVTDARLNPATTLVVALAARHRDWPYARVAALVKQYLTIPARKSLAKNLQWETEDFDGVEFVRQAEKRHGLDAFVKARAAEIDRNPHKRRAFHGATPQLSTRAAAEATADIGTTILTNIAGNVGGAVAKATIGDGLSSAGLSNVANFLGLGNQSEQLAGIADQLSAVSGQLTDINTTVTAIQNAVAHTGAALTQAEYSQLMTGVAGVTDVGTPNDIVLSSLTYATSYEDDVANAALSIPASGQSDPQAWCAANQARVAASDTLATACTLIVKRMGQTGGPTSSQLAKAGGSVAWCKSQVGGYGHNGMSALAYYTCEVIVNAGNSYVRGTGNDFATIYPLAAGAGGADGVVQSYAKELGSTLGGQSQALPLYLNATNYSVPYDDYLDNWEARIALLGLYQSVYDSFTSPGKQTCQLVPGGPITTVPPAVCDIQLGNQLAGNIVAPPIALPDIPANSFVSMSSGSAFQTGTAVAAQWWLVPEPSTCPTTRATKYLFSWAGLDGVSVECPFNAATASLDNGTSTPDIGWGLPPIGDLQALFNGSTDPATTLTGLGLPDLSGTTTEPLGAVGAVATSYNVANLWNPSATPTLTNTGTAFALWSGTCDTETWDTGYVSYDIAGDDDSIYEIAIGGQWCNYLGLADGVVHKQCVTVNSSPGIPCSAPTTPGTPTGPIGYQGFPLAASDGPVDFGHTAAVLAERVPTDEEYWLTPDTG